MHASVEQLPPLVVVEAQSAIVGRVRARLIEDGWRVVDGWDRPAAGEVRVGTVEDADSAAAALLAAVWGSGVVIHACADRHVVDRLLDDLRRLRAIDHVVGDLAEPLLTQDERALLRALRDGLTLGAAAKALHLSRRTADRRLASARLKLGVETTTEAVVLFER